MTELERDLGALAEKLQRSTVAVLSGHGAGSGSGVVWSPDTVVTNAHVAMSRIVDIEDAAGRHVRGTVERRDERRDLASIRVATADLVPADVRDPQDVRAGEMLVAFGHPLGVRNVLTMGIAFASHASGDDRFVRADLRIAPGNSGGAMADVQGRVVGINCMIAAGLALAVPASDVRRFLGEAAPSARIGVHVAAVRTREIGAAFAVLAVEPGSIADRSGIIAGDIIRAPDAARLGTATRVSVLRGGIAQTLTLVRDSDSVAAAA